MSKRPHRISLLFFILFFAPDWVVQETGLQVQKLFLLHSLRLLLKLLRVFLFHLLKTSKVSKFVFNDIYLFVEFVLQIMVYCLDFIVFSICILLYLPEFS